MIDEKRQRMVQMRISAIADLIDPNPDDYRSLEQKFRDAADKVYYLPIGTEGSAFEVRQFSPHTIEKWYRMWVKGGLEALYPKIRSDRGTSRTLTDENKAAIEHYHNSFRYMPASIIYKTMIDNGQIDQNKVSYSTVNRYVRQLEKRENG